MKNRRGAHLLAALTTALLLVSCSGYDQGDGPVTEGRDYQWDKEAGASDASAFMDVAIPEGATQTKGAVQINPQEDVYLLTFVTSEKTAEGIAEDLRSEEPLRVRKGDSAQGELFAHLGLPEPQTLKGARWAGVCPPCVSDHRRKKAQWIDIYVETLQADRARVYLQAF
ncbi:hypothetical protein ACWGH3_22435 [Streptomyces sp. NPDC054884]|uniref:hypothetical protein n=1 Tax=Streptomyces sp. ME08-AFT2 TaxID=3028683 RepID=UPI0029ABD211|nr:hypothetical protein [Streptomyces sp. ME08-AFT2]MDX3307648.1 hypothetical protein [Streptomyces sp. ME08-AFT2]